jgi:hypothetical protein
MKSRSSKYRLRSSRCRQRFINPAFAFFFQCKTLVKAARECLKAFIHRR